MRDTLYLHSGTAQDSMFLHFYDVRKYGAKADGKTNDAISIQKTIQACSKGGGGVVLFDKGVFLSGGIRLYDIVELQITSTAILMGTKNVADYNHDRKFKQGDGIRSLATRASNSFSSYKGSLTTSKKLTY